MVRVNLKISHPKCPNFFVPIYWKVPIFWDPNFSGRPDISGNPDKLGRKNWENRLGKREGNP